MIANKHFSWWYWLATATALAAGMTVFPTAIFAAIGFTTIQVIHFLAREKSVTAFPVQMRTAYLAMLLAGLWPPLVILHWIQLFGTAAMVTVDYCLLARVLSLMPWNRQQSLSRQLIWSTFISRPVSGNILQGLPPEQSSLA